MPAMAAIDPEIGVSGEENGIGHGLRHPDQTGIGQAHRHAGVLLHQLENRLEVLREFEGEQQRTAPE